MHHAEQFTLDLDGQLLETRLRAQWARNEAEQAARHHEDDYAMYWAGIPHRDIWLNLPGYERRRILELYNYEQRCLEWQIQSWEEAGGYLCEMFHPDGTSERWPRRPFRIREYHEVDLRPDRKAIEEHEALAQSMANQLMADWSAGRPASVATYNPMLASSVSLLLGRRIDYVIPDNLWGIPLSWQLLYAVDQRRESAHPVNRKSKIVNPE